MKLSHLTYTKIAMNIIKCHTYRVLIIEDSDNRGYTVLAFSLKYSRILSYALYHMNTPVTIHAEDQPLNHVCVYMTAGRTVVEMSEVLHSINTSL